MEPIDNGSAAGADHDASNPVGAPATPPPAPRVVIQVTPPPAPLGVRLTNALRELHDAEAAPQKTDAEKRAHEVRLAAARKNFSALQQGLPLIEMDADKIAQTHVGNPDADRAARLEILARANGDVAWLLDLVKQAAKRKE